MHYVSLLVFVFLFLSPVHAAEYTPGTKTHPDLLWIAQPDQLTAYSLYADEVRHQFALDGVRWMAADPATGRLWAGVDDEVLFIEADGAISEPGVPSPVHASVVNAASIDGTRRVAWLAAGDTLYRLSADLHTFIDTVSLPNVVEELVLDEAGGKLFVLGNGAVTVLDVASGAQSPLSIPGFGAIEHIALDRDARRLWLASASEVVALDENLAPQIMPVSHGIPPLQFLAADTAGGAWIAGTHELVHINADGLETTRSVPFDDTAGGGSGNASRLRELMPYPHGDVVWIANNKHVRQVDKTGSRSDVFQLPGSNAAIRLAVSHHDITPPEIWITQPTPELYTNDNRPHMDVVYTDYGSTVATDSLVLALDDVPQAVTCQATLQTALCIPDVAIPDGYYELSASIDDLAANTSDPDSLRFTVDTVPPVITVHSPAPGFITNQPELNLDISLNEFGTLTINDSDVEIDSEYRHESVVILQEGENPFGMVAVDRANNHSHATRNTLLDTIPPVIIISTPGDGSVTADDEITITGTVSEPVLLTLDATSLAVDGNSAFSVEVTLAEGVNAFNFVARDPAGNVTTAIHTIMRDTTPPEPIDPLLITFEYDATSNSYVFTGLPGAAEAGSTILVVPRNDGSTVGESLAELRQEIQSRFDVNPDGSFLVRVPASTLFDIYVVDPAGNRSAGISTAQLQEPVRDGKAVGVLAGELSVDPQGNANYRIPLAIAPGAAGMQPELALLYSSAAGNGQLGVGWSLSGLSAITRCPRDVAHEGKFRNVMYDGDDRLCLDGQRLKLHEDSASGYMAPGARYYTELASFQRIRAYGGSKSKGVNGFKVEDKAGLIRYYGVFNSTPDGRIETDGNDTAMIWLVSRIEDRYGNHIDYEYGYQRGEYWPEKIRWYNRNDLELGRVSMFYGGRPDKSLGALSNHTIRPMTKRLKRIVTYARVNGLQPMFSYLLTYEKGMTSGLSRIVAMEQCSGSVSDASAVEDGRCLPLTGFAYSDGQVSWGPATHTSSDFGNVSEQKTRFMDINLDGHADALWVASGTLRLKLSGSTSVINTGVSLSNEAANSWELADATGDGYADVVVPRRGILGNHFDVHPWNPSANTFSPANWLYRIGGQGVASPHPESRPIVADLDGDGDTDYIYRKDSANGTHRLVVHGVNGNQTTPWQVKTNQQIRLIEFNGDGLPDLLIDTTDCDSSPNSYVPIEDPDTGGGGSGGAGGGTTGNNCEQTSGILVNLGNGTFTDDIGPLDCIYLPPPPPPIDCVANCDPGTQIPEISSNPYYFPGITEESLSCSAVRGTNFLADHPIITDQNGDGLTDIITYTRSTRVWKLWLNSGGKFALADVLSTEDIAPFETAASLAADVNQDGVPDLIYQDEEDQHLLYMTDRGFGDQAPRMIDHYKELRFQDIDGDGDVDILRRDGSWYVRRNVGGRRDLLTAVITGTGERTAISYKPITTRNPVDGKNLYQGHLSSAESEKSLKLHRNGLPPMHVVASFATDSGTESLIATHYAYKGLKFDSKRGMLGFKEVRSHNENTGITTVNIHRQAWPYTGMVERSYQFVPATNTIELPDDDDVLSRMDWPCATSLAYCERDGGDIPVARESMIAADSRSLDAQATGKKISETVNTLASRTSAQGAVQPYVKETTSTEHDYNTGSAYRKTTSTFSYDAWGNAVTTTSSVGTSSGALAVTTSTQNSYEPVSGSNETWWCLGRLSSSTVTHSWAGKTATRKSSFGYSDGIPCQLNYEKVHALGEGDPQSLAIETFYTHDNFGNVESKRTHGWDGQGNIDRTTTTLYESTGRFPRTVSNAMGHSETQTYDRRFGLLVKTIGPNGLPSATELDDFGRVIKTIPVRSANTVSTVRAWCDGGTCFDKLSLFKEVKTAASGGQTITEYDRLGRVVKVAAKQFGSGWSTQEKRYDLLGREIAVSLPHAANDPVCWAFTTYDNINRPVLRATPPDNAVCGTIPRKVTQSELQAFQANPPAGYAIAKTAYNGLTTVMQDPEGRNTLREEYPSGWLRRVAELQNGDISNQIPAVRTQDGNALETTYIYDPVGNTVRVTDPAGNKVVMGYDNRGRKTWMNDPNMGRWEYQYNAFGELIGQQDAKGQSVVMRYDTLGRMVQRQEPEGVTQWIYDNAPGKGIGKLAQIEQFDGYREAFSYNQYGELENAVRVIDGQSYWQHTEYDVYGRPVDHYYPGYSSPTIAAGDAINPQNWSTDDSAFATRTEYDPRTGAPVRIRNIDLESGASTSTVYWQRLAVDAAGRTTDWSLGNGVTEHRDYNFATGLLKKQTTTGNYDSAANLDLTYTWDLAGNLLSRKDRITRANGTARVLTESFTYDALYRLDTVDRQLHGLTGNVRVLNHKYDAVGNLLTQLQGIDPAEHTGARGYAYGDPANTKIRPHAVNRASVNGKHKTYVYDANGNLTAATWSGETRSVLWTSFNKSESITKGQHSSSFRYAPNRHRYQQTDVAPELQPDGSTAIKTTTTTTVGAYEKIEKGTRITHRFNIFAGGTAIAVREQETNADTPEILRKQRTNFLHRDHLGSVVLITDQQGKKLERSGYSPWGQRINLNGFVTDSTFSATTGAGVAYTAPGTQAFHRGFTGHDMLEGVGLINMNGRIYDPEIGRFLSADPFVQFPESTQGFNRYTYVGNNPLTHVDPSGYSFKKALGKVLSTIAPLLNLIPVCYVWCAALASAVGGYLMTGSLEAGLMAGAMSAIGSGIGIAAADIGGFTGALVAGIGGGALSKAGGGRFSDGFLGGMAGSLAASSGIADTGNLGGDMAVGAIVGGTVAEIGGGKFANGAVSGAFAAAVRNRQTQDKALQKSSRYRLGVHSNVSEDAGMTDGHSWISLTDTVTGEETLYGLWPDEHPLTDDNGPGSDVRLNLERGRDAVASAYFDLSDEQVSLLMDFVNTQADWSYTHTCADWARDAVYQASDVYLDADDWLGFETPRELTQSINEYNALGN